MTIIWQLKWQVLYWLLLYSVVWALLTAGNGWSFGVPCVLAAASASVYLGLPPYRLHLQYLPGFVAFFLKALWSGGWDVARRAYDPRLPLNPGWVHYPLTQNNGRVSLVLSAMVGLLPGTLSSGISDGQLKVHVLDVDHPWRSTVSRLEQALSQLLGDHP